MRRRLYVRIAALGLAGLTLVSGATAPAQDVTTQLGRDGSIGPDASVQPTGTPLPEGGTLYEIGEDLGQRSDSGILFHSFETFSIGAADTVQFRINTQGPPRAVLTRVTGGTRSDIYGRLELFVPAVGPNLAVPEFFLLNPAGILIGPGSKVSSVFTFFASTADALEFADGSRFEANAAVPPPLLTLSNVSAFDFRTSSGSIQVDGAEIHVSNGTVGLIAGTPGTRVGLDALDRTVERPDLDGTLRILPARSFEGLILLSPGTAPASADAGKLTLRDTSVTTFGSRNTGRASPFRFEGTALFTGSSIDVQRSSIETFRNGILQLLTPGRVSIAESRTNVLELFGRVDISAAGIDISRSMLEGSFTLDSRGSAIRIRDSILTDGSIALTSDVGISLERSVLLAAQRTLLSQDPKVPPRLLGVDLQLDAPWIEVADRSQISTASSGPAGVPLFAAGNLQVRADRLRISGQSELSTQALVSPLILGPDGVPLSQPEIGRESNRAGSISIQVGELELLEGSRISSAALTNPDPPDPKVLFPEVMETRIEDFVLGSPGQIRIDASRSVRIAGGSLLDTSVDTTRSTQAGTISVSAPRIEIEGSSVRSTSVTTQAGDISLRASNELLLTGSSATSNASGSGTAGSVSVAGDAVRLDAGSALLSSNTGSGAAGSVRVEPGTGSLTLSGGSRIATRAVVGPDPGQPADGNIDIALSEALLLEEGSSIVASVEEGQGGDVRIASPRTTVLRGGSTILAETEEGRGGRIDVTTDVFLVDSTSRVSADAEVGTSGTVDIRSPDVDLQGGIAGLSAEFLNTSALLRPSCEARSEGASSLYLAGLRGAPPSPEDWLLAFDSPPAGPTVGAGPSAAVRVTADTGAGEDLLQLARSQQASGAYTDSIPTLESALAQAERTQDAPRVASVLGALGNAQHALGRENAAEVLLTRGAGIARERGDASLASGLQHDLGNHYASAGDAERARESYARAAELAERSGDVLGAAQAFAGAARLALESGEDASALLDRSEERIDALSSGDAKARLLIHVGRSRAAQARLPASPQLRARSLLRAHDRLRAAAELARTLDQPRLRAYALGNLAELYQSERRWEEALALTREALVAAELAQASDALYRWSWLEGQLLWARGKADPAVRAYRRAVQILEESRQESRARYGARATFFRSALAPIYLDLADVLLRSASSLDAATGRDALLLEARATMEKLKAAELRNYLRDDCSAQLEARTASLDSLATDAAVVYPIVLRDRLELLVRLPSGLERFTVPVGAERIEAEALAFRRLVQDRTSAAYRPLARQLYDWLVRPYAARLAAAKLDTLVFVPDGALRSIPMAALHDGERFLAERFGLATTPGLSLVDPRPLDLANVKPLIGGVSEAVQEFPALGNVPSELEAIRDLFGGDVLLDASFQSGRIQNAVQEGRPTLVHFASHAIFTGDPATSFLLTHDGRITMDQLGALLARTRLRPDPIELLVLSACETAAGDERAELGLAGVAVRAGARSALGSLWPISDEATYPLIVQFYERLREPGGSRAAALRHAQRALLATPEFSHPFYWSTFVLINNWL